MPLFAASVGAMAALEPGRLAWIGAAFGIAHGFFYPAFNALALEGAACQFGTQCAGALVCVKPRGGGQGDCQPAPSGCEPLRCDCALTLCAQLEGSSCSAGDLDDPESSLTVSCAP